MTANAPWSASGRALYASKAARRPALVSAAFQISVAATQFSYFLRRCAALVTLRMCRGFARSSGTASIWAAGKYSATSWSTCIQVPALGSSRASTGVSCSVSTRPDPRLRHLAQLGSLNFRAVRALGGRKLVQHLESDRHFEARKSAAAVVPTIGRRRWPRLPPEPRMQTPAPHRRPARPRLARPIRFSCSAR